MNRLSEERKKSADRMMIECSMRRLYGAKILKGNNSKRILHIPGFRRTVKI